MARDFIIEAPIKPIMAGADLVAIIVSGAFTI
jgi:hypothetical protein